MLAEEIITHIENWAPPGITWNKDNVGLQVGSVKTEISNIMVSLEFNKKVFNEAVNKKCNFIFTHHPFIFHPITRINTNDKSKGELIEKLIKQNITLYSAHTNLDYTKDGVSFELAKTLKLKNVRFLEQQKENQFKVVVFIPEDAYDKVAQAAFNAGGGVIGEYSKCSFNTTGTGTFEGSENSNPQYGNKKNFEKVSEIKFEVLVNEWLLNKVITAIKKSHPYEEPAYDIIPLKNKNANYGAGAIGTLEQSMSKNEFLSYVLTKLNAKGLRYVNGKKQTIKTVAVCGGTCSDLLNKAIAKKADAFITADIKYHTFQEGENKILFIDAGHYETEVHSLNVVKRKIENLISNKGEAVKVYKFSGSTNPVKFFNKIRS